MKNTVSIELQNTVKTHPNIKKVYFDANGNHFFHYHDIDLHKVNDEGVSIKVDKVKALPGSRQGIVKIKKKNGNMPDTFEMKRVNVDYTPIEEEVDREEILSAKAVHKGLSVKQEDDIVAHAIAILQARGLDTLLGEKTKEKAKEEKLEEDPKKK